MIGKTLPKLLILMDNCFEVHPSLKYSVNMTSEKRMLYFSCRSV